MRKNIVHRHSNRSPRLSSQVVAPYVFLLPIIAIFSIFVLYPFVYSIILSFQKFEAGAYKFNALQNYINLLQDKIFWTSLKNTVFYLAIQVPVMIVLSLFLASVVESKLIRGKSIFRMSIFLPVVIALVAYSIVFRLIFSTDYGILNYFLSCINIGPVDWLTTKWGARIAILIAITWRWTGYNTIVMIAGLQQIPHVLYEAAEIDGADFWTKFWRITVPTMKPIILFVSITSTIGTLQLFDEPYTLTEGGPNNATITIAMYLYNTAFRYFKFGYSAAMSIILMLIIVGLSLIQFKVSGDDDT